MDADVSLPDLELGRLRSEVSLLLQEAVLFTGSIRENIRYGRLGATDEEVEARRTIAVSNGDAGGAWPGTIVSRRYWKQRSDLAKPGGCTS